MVAMTHDEAQWLVDALISVTTLCVRCEERGVKENFQELRRKAGSGE